MAEFRVTLVPCLQDNYAYLVTDGSGLCAVVDPSEPGPVKKALAAQGLKLTHILNTHHHLDHCGGNLALKEEFGAEVVGPGNDRGRIPGIDTGVGEAAPWRFGSHDVQVLEIPAHTSSHIAFVFGGMAFTGDTLFQGGPGATGRSFSDEDQIKESIRTRLFALGDDTVVHTGHGEDTTIGAERAGLDG